MIRAIILCLILAARALSAQSLSDDTLQKIAFTQKPGAQVSLDLPFRDESGKQIRLGDYFDKKPVILVMGYYGCPMLCTVVLNGLLGTMQDMKLKLGRDYEVIDVSINPRETYALAAEKKKSYLAHSGQRQAAAGWHFLTGDEPAIRQLAGEVGFNYAYDSTLGQYAHPSGLVILSSTGKISHYLSGVEFDSHELTRCLADAADAKIGSPIEQIFLLCFHYSPVTGKYSGVILGVVRVLGVAVLVGVAAFIITRRKVAP